jgi:hypothetical protein
MAAPDLDAWVPQPALRVSHAARSPADAQRVWRAARELRLLDTRLLGRLVRWRIPGAAPGASFDELLRERPFNVLQEGELLLVSGIVGRIWTVRRDYPRLSNPEEFRSWTMKGTARVMFANWVEDGAGGGCVLRSETRVQAFGVQGRVGLGSVRPLIVGFQQLIATDAMAAALRSVESGEGTASS